MRRRDSLAVLAALAGAGAASSRAAAQPFPGVEHEHDRVDPDYRMSFPRDFGAHPGFRTEWWYVTGWLGKDHGFQVTFFRVRTTHPQENPSRYAPTQLLFAHAALMLPKNRHALHAQRAARAGLSGARFSMQDADVAIGDWWLKRAADDRYRTVVRDGELEFDLTLAPPGPPGDPRNSPWLQDLRGFSRKGPRPEQASHYYSRPQLRVSGSANGEAVSGVAWFDHEWSTTYLDPAADGWDWTGINLDDGGALVAFRIRPRQPGPDLWRYCAVRHPDGRIERFDDVQFEVLRSWQSPRTSTRYPVSIGLVLPRRRLRLEPLFDDQELDGRGSTGTIYWEGAVRVLDEGGKRLGRGYLELTGYQSPLKM